MEKALASIRFDLIRSQSYLIPNTCATQAISIIPIPARVFEQGRARESQIPLTLWNNPPQQSEGRVVSCWNIAYWRQWIMWIFSIIYKGVRVGGIFLKSVLSDNSCNIYMVTFHRLTSTFPHSPRLLVNIKIQWSYIFHSPVHKIMFK